MGDQCWGIEITWPMLKESDHVTNVKWQRSRDYGSIAVMWPLSLNVLVTCRRHRRFLMHSEHGTVWHQFPLPAVIDKYWKKIFLWRKNLFHEFPAKISTCRHIRARGTDYLYQFDGLFCFHFISSPPCSCTGVDSAKMVGHEITRR